MKSLNHIMADIDALLEYAASLPYYGWHNDHVDGPNYRPALQQDRNEFRQMLEFVADKLPGFRGGSCLQLGMGPSGISHEVWRRVFACATTIDLAVLAVDGSYHRPGLDTHSSAAFDWACDMKMFDFLFIDAGHSYEDVELDYYNFSLLVRPGGVLAFHDALERKGYPEVKVHQFLKDAKLPVTIFGDEVGTAVMVKS